MPEEIDRLVVSLGLDPSDFSDGVRRANKATDELEQGQQRTVERGAAARRRLLERASREDLARKRQEQREFDKAQRATTAAEERAAKAAEDRASRVADSLGKVATAAIGVMGAFEIGRGLTTVMAQLTQADAALGRLSTNLGVTPQKLGGLQNALLKIGGSADEAGAGIGSLVTIGQQVQMGQIPASAQFLQMAGVTLQDLQNPQVALEKLANYFQKVGPRQAQYIGGQIGLPPDLINLMEGGAKKFDAAWNAGEGDAANQKDVDASQKLQSAFSQVDQDFTEAARRLRDDLAPALLWLLQQLDRIARWAKANPVAAGAAGLGASVVGATVGGSLLRRAVTAILGRGGAGAASAAAEATAAEEVLAAGGAVALSPALLAAAAAAGVLLPSNMGGSGEEKELNRRYPNRPRGNAATADRTLPPVAQSLLNSIGGSEAPGGYNELYGGGTFSGSQFPNWKGVQVGTDADGNPIMTHAAGRYQFEPGTWAEAQKALSLPDFSPKSQDQAAWWLAQRDYRSRTGRDLLTDLRSHDPKIDSLIRKTLGPTWTSLLSRSDTEFARSLETPASGSSSSAAASSKSDGLPASVETYLASLRHSASAAAAQHSETSTVSHNTTSTHVGEVHVHTAATDADGIARDMRGSMMRYSWAAQANTGLS